MAYPKPKFKKGDLVSTKDSPRSYGKITHGPTWNVMADDWGYELTTPYTAHEHAQKFKDVGENSLQRCANVFPHTDPTSGKILSIRFKAGNDMTKCPTCGRSAGAPYREHARPDGSVPGGVVTAGCIDPIHTGHLYGESLRWHNRKEAKELRSQELKHLESLKSRKS